MRFDYITTAIVYPNSRIHVGWAWECIGADWLVRCLKMLGRPTRFLTGTDEHALKVQRAAEAKGFSPQFYCDQMASDITKVLNLIGIEYDRFIRTSDPDHVWVVKNLIQKVFDKGDIYLGKYEGYYCEGCEAFYSDKDLRDGVCPQHNKAAKWISEENYFFRLSKYQDRLLKHIEENPDFIRPTIRKSEIVNFVRSGLKDFSVSRSTFTWGVTLPFDQKKIVYVWFDALINYLTGAGIEGKIQIGDGEVGDYFSSCWPAKLHIIGKDVLRFHAVYWPAMLMSLDLPLPEGVFAHGFLQLGGERLSKSTGNSVTPDEVVAVTGADPFRYYLLSENTFAKDGNFAWENLILKNNADLANDWGNLVNRSISMTRKYFPNQEIKMTFLPGHSQEIVNSFEALKLELKGSVQAIDPSGYIASIQARCRLLNLYIDQRKPWVLAKSIISEPSKTTSPDGQVVQELHCVMYTLLEGIRWLATLFMPVLPFKMPEVFFQLGLEVPGKTGTLDRLNWGEMVFQPKAPQPIYPRIELDKIPSA